MFLGKSLLSVLFFTVFASSAYAGPCASTVLEGKRNGVYRHFLKVSAGATMLHLKRYSDGRKVSAGVSRGKFKVLGRAVTICKTGSKSISAKSGSFNGSVTRIVFDGGRAYKVVAPFGFSGTYLPVSAILEKAPL